MVSKICEILRDVVLLLTFSCHQKGDNRPRPVRGNRKSSEHQQSDKRDTK